MRLDRPGGDRKTTDALIEKGHLERALSMINNNKHFMATLVGGSSTKLKKEILEPKGICRAIRHHS